MSNARWGNPVWILLHTFAEKLREDVYRNNYEACFSFVRHISEHVPCHVCRMESKRYLSKVDCGELQTKECFKLFLFMFHNDVNRRLGKRLFTLSELNNYKSTAMAIVLPFFLSRVGTPSLCEFVESFLSSRSEWFHK